jgi:hypothetical protein
MGDPRRTKVSGVRRLTMPSGLRWGKVTATLLVWTVVFAGGVLLGKSLNVGVTEDDIQECMEEQIIPPEKCEETLQAAEDEEFRIAVPVLFLIWFGGALAASLVWLLIGPQSRESTRAGVGEGVGNGLRATREGP